ILQFNQLDPTALYLVAGERSADQGNSQIGGDEAFDHPNTGQFHANLQIRIVGAKQLIEHAPGVARLWEKQRIFYDIRDRNYFVFGQRIFRADHQQEFVAKYRLNFQARGLDRQSENAHIDLSGFQFLYDLIAEVSIDADLNRRIAAAIFGKDLG